VVLFFLKRTRAIVWQGLRFALPVAAVALVAVKCGSLVSAFVVARVLVGLAVFGLGALLSGCLKASDVSYFSSALKRALEKTG